jgi:flavin-dependent dehydrogenase
MMEARMADSQFDLIIIGGGPGGYVAAIRAAQLGLRVALVERDNLGGICLNWGCIPTKALLKNASVVETLRHANDYGIHVEKFSADFGKAIDRSRVVANRLVKGVEFLMKKNKVEVIKGEATLSARDRVEIKAMGARSPRRTSSSRPARVPFRFPVCRWMVKRSSLRARRSSCANFPRRLSSSARDRLGWNSRTSIARTARR